MKHSEYGRKSITLLLTTGLWFGHAAAQTESEPGQQVFKDHCSSCHVSEAEASATQIAPSFEALKSMSAASLEFAINEGVMYGQASVLSNAQKSEVVAYLAREIDDSWLQPTLCTAGTTVLDLDGRVSLARFGVDYLSTRHMSSMEAGLNKEDFANLEVAWALAFPDVSALRASPVIVGDTVFYAATGSRKVMALDVSSGCAKWVFDSPTRLRSSLAYGPLGPDGPEAIVYGDAEGFVYALAAATGEMIWSRDVRSHGRGCV